LIFDLVDVGREYLSIGPCITASNALAASTNISALVAANASMTKVMADIDKLLGASDGFLLGRWIADARMVASVAGRPVHDQDFLEWNARAQVTSWSPSYACDGSATSIPGLWDYGNKAWSGLVRGYYDRRYQLYADYKKCSLLPDDESCRERPSFVGAVMQLACEFARNKSVMPSEAAGDAVAISESLWSTHMPL
jgi:alpha-N-acetylglucosaminidase